MHARSVPSMLLGAILGFGTAQSASAATYVNDLYGSSGYGYNTIIGEQNVDPTEISTHSITAWIHHTIFYFNTVHQSVRDAIIETRPATSGYNSWYLSFAGAPPIPYYWAGTWDAYSGLALEYYHWIVVNGVPHGGYDFYCVLWGTSEPCEDSISVHLE